MRDKLIEILRKPIFPHELVDPTEAVADYLLDNGVIVLPCKVGDTVWCISPLLCIYRERDMCAEYCEGFNSLCEDYEGGKLIVLSRFTLSMLDDIGKTVFLTKEEAEAALKEGE